MSEMQTLLSAVETGSAKKNFYPTPGALAERMLLDVDPSMYSAILEPSAGKGDLAQAIAAKIRRERGRWRSDENEKATIDCVEIDPNLRAILKERGFRVIHDDFLTLHTFKRYDLIIMNPPFDRGAEHLLKAIDLLQHDGGRIVCLLNAETLRNRCTHARQKLGGLVEEYEGTVEEIADAFSAAERRADVDVAIVRLTIPAPERKSGIVEGLRQDFAARAKNEKQEEPYAALIKSDYLEAAVDRYNFELSVGLRLINEWRAMKPLLSRTVPEKEGAYDKPILELVMDNQVHRGGQDANPNDYIGMVRKKYWSALFQQRQFMAQLTSNLREDLQRMVDDLVDYDFSYYNIYTLMQQMLLRVNGGIEETIMKLFDDWTRKYHYDENSQNRHYFDGWCTNDAFAVNKKVIIPFYGAYDTWNHDRLDKWHVTGRLADIEKVFDFLDGGRAQGEDSTAVIEKAIEEGQTKNIQCRHFLITFYKKGTAHIVFTNLGVLHKFNLFAAMGKKWLPPAYGRKHYKDMTPGEQATVDSFEGREHYEQEVMAHADYYLTSSASTVPLLMG